MIKNFILEPLDDIKIHDYCLLTGQKLNTVKKQRDENRIKCYKTISAVYVVDTNIMHMVPLLKNKAVKSFTYVFKYTKSIKPTIVIPKKYIPVLYFVIAEHGPIESLFYTFKNDDLMIFDFYNKNTAIWKDFEIKVKYLEDLKAKAKTNEVEK